MIVLDEERNVQTTDDEGRSIQVTDDLKKGKTRANSQDIEEDVESQTTANEIDMLDQFANPENKILKYLGSKQEVSYQFVVLLLQ